MFFGQRRLIRKGVEWACLSLGMDEEGAKIVGKAASFIAAIATPDVADRDDDDDDDDYDDDDWD